MRLLHIEGGSTGPESSLIKEVQRLEIEKRAKRINLKMEEDGLLAGQDLGHLLDGRLLSFLFGRELLDRLHLLRRLLLLRLFLLLDLHLLGLDFWFGEEQQTILQLDS